MNFDKHNWPKYIPLFQRHPVWEDLWPFRGGLHCPGDVPWVPRALHPLWQATLHPPQCHEGPCGALSGQEHAGGGRVLYSPPGDHQSRYTPGKLKMNSIFNHGFCRWESYKWCWNFFVNNDRYMYWDIDFIIRFMYV